MTPSIDELLNSDDETRVVITLSKRINQRIKEFGFDGLPEPCKVFYRVYWLEAEINNGGFNQYFFNSAGDHVEGIVEALKIIGANYTAQLAQEAMSVFPSGAAPKDRNQRQAELLKIGEEREDFLYRLDNEFYKYNDPISSLLLGYVKQHKGQF